MNTPKSERRPIIDPLLLMLRSRRMLIALSALIAGVVVSLLPELEAVYAELLTLLMTLALGLIGGYSIEDAAIAARERATQERQEVDTLVKDVLITLVDETLRERQTTE